MLKSYLPPFSFIAIKVKNKQRNITSIAYSISYSESEKCYKLALRLTVVCEVKELSLAVYL